VLAFFVGLLIYLFPIALLAIFSSSFPRSGSLYVVISRITHPILGFMPNWSYVIGGGAALAVGFLNYLGLIPVASSFQLAGTLAHNQFYTTVGEALARSSTRLWISIIITLIMWFLETRGLDKLKWVLRAIIYIPLALTAVAILSFFFANGANSFSAVYGANAYENVRALAASLDIKSAYLPPGQAMQGMLLSVIWAFTAAEAVSYVGSEVKSPRMAFMRGMLLGLLAVGALYVVNAYAVLHSFGSNFITEYSWLYYNHSAELAKVLGTATPPAPSIPFYASIILKNPIISITLGIGYFLWYLNTSMIIWMAGVRGIFAMSFDRLIPLKFAEIGRNGSPTWANHIVGIFALLGTFVGLGDSLGLQLSESILALLDFTTLFFIWPLGLAGMFFPFARPDLFEKSTFQYKIGKVPLISIIGGVTFFIGWWLILYVGSYQDPLAQILNAVLLLAGLILMAVMWYRNRKEGIDSNKIFSEIPPA
jgi:amino acid transporter